MQKSLIEFEISPSRLEKGRNELTVRVKNKGLGELKNAVMKLVPLDLESVTVSEPEKKVGSFGNGKDAVLYYTADAAGSAGVYLSIDAEKDGEPIHVETPVKGEDAEGRPAVIEGIDAKTGVYEPPGNKFYFDIILRGLNDSQNLIITNQIELPDGDTEIMDDIPVGELKAEEEKIVTSFIVPEIKGPYTVYSYLYNGEKTIDRSVEKIFIEDTGEEADTPG